MQEKLLMGAGIHSKAFKSGPQQLKIVISAYHLDDIQKVIDYFEKEESQYIKNVEIIN